MWLQFIKIIKDTQQNSASVDNEQKKNVWVPI